MSAANFVETGTIRGVQGGPVVINNNPTSLQFGPDQRLYVAEQNGSINAFNVTFVNGEYIATAHEELQLASGLEAVRSLQNHRDDNGAPDTNNNRQVTGIVVTGTPAQPVLYVSSSDPRIAANGESNDLDTNSGVITRLTLEGGSWDAVDIIRGLPRSEENHSNNGMVLSPDGTKLFIAVGGNTNNGAPSTFFSYTAEYALSGTVLEVDLEDIDGRPILVDPLGGQNSTPRNYIYDLPTLDDPNIPNDGVREDANGMDTAGPWGGNDGLNQAILPADAPLRIYADGLRNHFDLAMTPSGQLYTFDNGSNGNLGGDPIFVGGEATNLPNDGGQGDSDALFLIEDGGYYGHPNPIRSNQNQSYTVYNNNGDPDADIAINNVPNIAARVPSGVAIPAGFIIAPTKFTGDAQRLQLSGVRQQRVGPNSNALVTSGTSSNGLLSYTSNAFGNALNGDLIVAQFNGNVTRIDLTNNGQDAVLEEIGGMTSLSIPLDVTEGPNGTLWTAELGGDMIRVWSPVGFTPTATDDTDGDGLLNSVDPFLRDPANGLATLLFPGQTLLWDFDANQDNNLPGPDGYGGGLTGVMIDGETDFDAFFQSPRDGQSIQLNNVKFITAAGGGTTVIEEVSNGDPITTQNDGQFLFHTGMQLANGVNQFTVSWDLFNPSVDWTGPFQQIGGYIGTGDQSTYLKIVAIAGPGGPVQVLFEDEDLVIAEQILTAPGLIGAPLNSAIRVSLAIDLTAETVTPTITYDTAAGSNTVTGAAMSISDSNLLDNLNGLSIVDGQSTGIALGLMSTNFGQAESDTFLAIFSGIEVVAAGDSVGTVVHRLNTGGPTIAAIDGAGDWLTDQTGTGASFLVAGGPNTASFPAVEPGPTVPGTTPATIYDTERWDPPAGAEMSYDFPVILGATYEVRMFLGNGFTGTAQAGARIYDVTIEGTSFTVDPSADFGHLVGGVLSSVVAVNDATLDIDFAHAVENPLVNGIEIIQLDAAPDSPPAPAPAPDPTPAPTPPPPSQDIQLDFINTTNGAVVAALTDGGVVSVAGIPVDERSIVANISNSAVESVSFELVDGSGNLLVDRTENVLPYALLGDTAGGGAGRIISGGTIPAGSYYLTVEGFAGNNQQGALLASTTLHFSLVENSGGTPPGGGAITLAFFNTVDDSLLADISNGGAVNVNGVPANQRSIVASFVDGSVESVSFVLVDSSGNTIASQTENLLPYALFGDSPGNPRILNGGTVPPGDYNLTVEGYSANNLQGTLLDSVSVQFSVISN